MFSQVWQDTFKGNLLMYLHFHLHRYIWDENLQRLMIVHFFGMLWGQAFVLAVGNLAVAGAAAGRLVGVGVGVKVGVRAYTHTYTYTYTYTYTCNCRVKREIQ
jgi:hypothetical protein